LAREASDEDVDGFDVVPVDGGDVTQVWDVRPVAGKEAGDGFVDLGEPAGFGVEGVLDGQVEASVAAE
jgi:hypothetical protein